MPADPVSVSQARTFPLSLAPAYDRTIVADLPTLFAARHLALPPVAAVEDQDGAWGRAVGQTRTIRTSDGGRLRETLTELDAPHRFAYRIDVAGGPMRPLVDHLDGSWTFTAAGPAGEWTEICWAWVLHPRSALTRAAVTLVARMWAGYADKALAALEPMVVHRAPPDSRPLRGG